MAVERRSGQLPQTRFEQLQKTKRAVGRFLEFSSNGNDHVVEAIDRLNTRNEQDIINASEEEIDSTLSRETERIIKRNNSIPFVQQKVQSLIPQMTSLHVSLAQEIQGFESRASVAEKNIRAAQQTGRQVIIDVAQARLARILGEPLRGRGTKTMAPDATTVQEINPVTAEDTPQELSITEPEPTVMPPLASAAEEESPISTATMTENGLPPEITAEYVQQVANELIKQELEPDEDGIFTIPIDDDLTVQTKGEKQARTLFATIEAAKRGFVFDGKNLARVVEKQDQPEYQGSKYSSNTNAGLKRYDTYGVQHRFVPKTVLYSSIKGYALEHIALQQDVPTHEPETSPSPNGVVTSRREATEAGQTEAPQLLDTQTIANRVEQIQRLVDEGNLDKSVFVHIEKKLRTAGIVLQTGTAVTPQVIYERGSGEVSDTNGSAATAQEQTSAASRVTKISPISPRDGEITGRPRDVERMQQPLTVDERAVFRVLAQTLLSKKIFYPGIQDNIQREIEQINGNRSGIPVGGFQREKFTQQQLAEMFHDAFYKMGIESKIPEKWDQWTEDDARAWSRAKKLLRRMEDYFIKNNINKSAWPSRFMNRVETRLAAAYQDREY